MLRETGYALVLAVDAFTGRADAEGGDDILKKGSIVAGNLEIHPLLLARLTAAK